MEMHSNNALFTLFLDGVAIGWYIGCIVGDAAGGASDDSLVYILHRLALIILLKQMFEMRLRESCF